MIGVLYETHTGEYLRGTYEYVRKEPAREHGVAGAGPDDQIYVSGKTPLFRSVDVLEVIQFLVAAQLAIPDELLDHLGDRGSPPARPEPRAPEAFHPLLDEFVSRTPSDRGAPVEIAEQLLKLARPLLRELREFFDAGYESHEDAPYHFATALFEQYELGESVDLELLRVHPLGRIGLLDLEWPVGAEPIADAIREMRDLCRDPLALLAGEWERPGGRIHSTPEEVAVAYGLLEERFDDLIDTVGRLEARLAGYRETATEAIATFRPADGGMFEVGWGETRAPKMKGHELVRLLLSHPGREFSVADLHRILEDGERAPLSLSGDAVDDEARSEVRRRLEELSAARERAERDQDHAALGEIDEETAQLETYLEQSHALGGRPRAEFDDVTRARDRLAKQVTRVLGKLQTVAPQLERHLRATLRTAEGFGYFPNEAVRWQLRPGEPDAAAS